jgi:hypothetical protein
MDERVIKSLLRRLDKLERRSSRLRFGRVTAPNPLSVSLGGVADPGAFTDVRTLAPGVYVKDDYVAVLVSGNDLLVLGKVI